MLECDSWIVNWILHQLQTLLFKFFYFINGKFVNNFHELFTMKNNSFTSKTQTFNFFSKLIKCFIVNSSNLIIKWESKSWKLWYIIKKFLSSCFSTIRRVDNIQAILSLLIIEFCAPFWPLQIGCNSYIGWQPITAKITSILAAISEDGLLIGQFLVSLVMSQPIHRVQVGALIRQ